MKDVSMYADRAQCIGTVCELYINEQSDWGMQNDDIIITS